MAETKRLNSTLVCTGCQRPVNPYVVKDANGYADKIIECPFCVTMFTAHCDRVVAWDGVPVPVWIPVTLS